MLQKIKEAVKSVPFIIRFCSRKPQRALRICENVSLGERSSVAVLEFEQQKFLIGVTGTSMSLLASLKGGDAAGSRADVADDIPTWAWKEGFKRESA